MGAAELQAWAIFITGGHTQTTLLKIKRLPACGTTGVTYPYLTATEGYPCTRILLLRPAAACSQPSLLRGREGRKGREFGGEPAPKFFATERPLPRNASLNSHSLKDKTSKQAHVTPISLHSHKRLYSYRPWAFELPRWLVCFIFVTLLFFPPPPCFRLLNHGL